MAATRSGLTPQERVAADVALALRTRQVPREERAGRVSPRREIACRSCAAWMTRETGTWRHEDGTPACVDPGTLAEAVSPSPYDLPDQSTTNNRSTTP